MQGAHNCVSMGELGWGTQDNGIKPKAGLERCYHGGKTAKRTSGLNTIILNGLSWEGSVVVFMFIMSLEDCIDGKWGMEVDKRKG